MCKLNMSSQCVCLCTMCILCRVSMPWLRVPTYSLGSRYWQVPHLYIISACLSHGCRGYEYQASPRVSISPPAAEEDAAHSTTKTLDDASSCTRWAWCYINCLDQREGEGKAAAAASPYICWVSCRCHAGVTCVKPAQTHQFSMYALRQPVLCHIDPRNTCTWARRCRFDAGLTQVWCRFNTGLTKVK
jgi:hypothetical protein